MRRDRVMECTIAAIAGIGLAAVLTASLGVRSSGDPTPLRSEVATAAKPVVMPAEETSKPAKAARKHAARKRHVRRHHRLRVQVRTAAAPAPSPVVAQTAPVTTETQAPSTPIRTQAVTPTPAPKPAPVKTPSRPKPSVGGGVSFDDSG